MYILRASKQTSRKIKQQFVNLMYIMLLKVYCSSFKACIFNWLIDGRPLVKTKSNNLVKSVCFRMPSMAKTAEILVRNKEVTVWKYTVKSKVQGTWNMKNTVFCWCQNRLAYVMVLVQIHTLLLFEQFIL